MDLLAVFRYELNELVVIFSSDLLAAWTRHKLCHVCPPRKGCAYNNNRLWRNLGVFLLV